MRKMMLSVIVALTLATQSYGQTKINVVENPSKTTSFVEASINTSETDSAVWFVTPEPVKTVESGNTIYFNGPAGVYTVQAVVFSVNDKGKIVTKKYRTTVTIGDPEPPAPPTPPAPVDPFSTSVLTAFKADTDANKATYAAKLSSLYKQAAATTVDQVTDFTTLLSTLQTARKSMFPDTGIVGVRTAIQTRLNGSLQGTYDKAKAKSEFLAIAAALDACK